MAVPVRVSRRINDDEVGNLTLRGTFAYRHKLKESLE